MLNVSAYMKILYIQWRRVPLVKPNGNRNMLTNAYSPHGYSGQFHFFIQNGCPYSRPFCSFWIAARAWEVKEAIGPTFFQHDAEPLPVVVHRLELYGNKSVLLHGEMLAALHPFTPHRFDTAIKLIFSQEKRNRHFRQVRWPMYVSSEPEGGTALSPPA